MNAYIVADKDICSGRPCFRGTRLPVSLVLGLLGGGKTPEQILKGYPGLTKKHIQAALRFASEVTENNMSYASFV
ncbi:MAG: DUF433 domain-containing protein [Candidatus Omnitrophica bacterium]|nr:DUF433 domain-containing protein [Candidatus Omnitrophota bacterium]